MQLVTLHIIYICLPFLFREMWFIIMDAYVGLVRLKHNIVAYIAIPNYRNVQHRIHFNKHSEDCGVCTVLCCPC